jgi:hypothetical protein
MISIAPATPIPALAVVERTVEEALCVIIEVASPIGAELRVVGVDDGPIEPPFEAIEEAMNKVDFGGMGEPAFGKDDEIVRAVDGLPCNCEESKAMI